jgi:hypothetical protein
MAKRIKQTIDVSQLFNNALVTPQQQMEVIRSDAWPIIIAAYSALEGNLLVHRLGKNIVHLSDKAGISVAAIHRTDELYHFMISDSAFAIHDVDSHVHYSSYMTSKHPKYIASKLRGQTDVRTKLVRTVNEIATRLNGMLQHAVDNVVDKCAGKNMQPANISLTDAESTYATKIMMGACSVHAIPKHIYEAIQNKYNNYTAGLSKLHDAIDKAKEFYGANKFLYVPAYNGGILLGAISPQPMLAALDRYKVDKLPPAYDGSYSYIDFTMPFQWYPNIESVPDNVRSQLETSLLMFKAHTGLEKVVNGTDRTGNDRVFLDINAYLHGNYNYMDLIMLDQ